MLRDEKEKKDFYSQFKPVIFIVVSVVISLWGFNHKGDSYYYESQMFYNNQEYQKAIEAAENALKYQRSDVSLDLVYKIIGASYQDLENYDSAIEYYNKALKENPDNYLVWTNLGVVYRRSDEYEKALNCYKKAIEINPEYAKAYSCLGSYYIFQNNAESAINNFNKAIKLDPSLAVAHGNLALALAMADRFDEADEELEKAKTLGYDNYQVIKEQIDDLKREYAETQANATPTISD